ncbi:hypothetical protein PAL_GLEAN10008215 [Pteropus alecto]|uniref:Uncharacterized protein n=1 Tax=Pteropus alecto TaxID=9402 RepID=L5K3Q9_PTEAL|nr:hypothetical protein PAL_GLEAN10008215 [Pteropus alecto]
MQDRANFPWLRGDQVLYREKRSPSDACRSEAEFPWDARSPFPTPVRAKWNSRVFRWRPAPIKPCPVARPPGDYGLKTGKCRQAFPLPHGDSSTLPCPLAFRYLGSVGGTRRPFLSHPAPAAGPRHVSAPARHPGFPARRLQRCGSSGTRPAVASRGAAVHGDSVTRCLPSSHLPETASSSLQPGFCMK